MPRDDRTNALLPTILYALALGVFAAVCRLLPYYLPDASPWLWNVAPMGALALFVGSRLRGPYASLIPLGALLASDLLLIRPLAEMGYSAFGWGRPLVYASFVLYMLLGRLVPARDLSPWKIGTVAVAGGVQFFLISNFLVWYFGSTYPHTLAGLGFCYAAAVPFYGNTLVSDLFFTGLFFALHQVLFHVVERGKARQPA